jgi:diguanylate cyclase (GGDEF)-like protein
LRFGEIRTTDTATIVPLRVGDLTLGVLFAERRCTSPQTVELLGILANQATVAIQNMQLYEVAALDPLTGVHARRFFEQWMRREVRTAFRSRKHTSILLIDVDGMKSINDSAGHLVGDQALAITGQALRSAVRGNDVVGRYGGDEFIVLLPETAAARAQKVALRILAAFEDKRVPGTSDRMPLRCSIGLGELEPRPEPATALRRPVPATYFQRMAQALIANCAQALLRARAQGGGRLALGEPTAWAEIPDTGEGL